MNLPDYPERTVTYTLGTPLWVLSSQQKAAYMNLEDHI